MRNDVAAAIVSAAVTLLSTSALACEKQQATTASQQVASAAGVLLAQATNDGGPVAPPDRGPKSEAPVGDKSAVIVNPDGSPASPKQPLASKQVNKEEAQKLGQEVK